MRLTTRKTSPIEMQEIGLLLMIWSVGLFIIVHINMNVLNMEQGYQFFGFIMAAFMGVGGYMTRVKGRFLESKKKGRCA